jgi:membrane protease subunit HflK
MPWQNQGGGGGPWGGGQGPWGSGPSGGQRPPDLEDMLRQGQDRLRRFMPGGFGSGRSLALIAVVAVILWLFTGFYRVQPDQQGVELVFGQWVGTTGPGLNYNWPAPIGDVATPMVTKVNRVEVGFRSSTESTASARDVVAESLMLTGDENIIDIQFVVFWVIKDAGLFLFNIRDPEATVKNVAESAMREIVGQTNFERARTEGRAEIEARTLELIQGILDQYGAGILAMQVELQKVDPPEAVIEAFRDVQAARADRERSVNEAQAYFNEVTQRAEGQAQRIVKEAEAYRAEKIAIAEGEAQRFVTVYQQYVTDKDVTTRRLYLETMERVLQGMDKVLIDRDLGGGAVPYLSLNELMQKRGASPQATQEGGASEAPATGSTQ